MDKRNVIIIASIIAVAAVGMGYYTLSPLWMNVELNETSPLDSGTPTPQFKDDFETMDQATMDRFRQEMEAMKDQEKAMTEGIPGEAKVLAQGDFKPRAHDVAGKALLIEKDGQKILRFEDFETINGPNVDIYLSADLGDSDIIDLGDIRATKGNVNYTLPPGTDTQKYNKVLVWCKDFRVLFSYAELN